jgi:hypothetical protein
VKLLPIVLLLAGALPASGRNIGPEMLRPENRTASESKQITVFGGTRSQRAALVRRAEELKKGLLRSWREDDRWTSTVLVVLAPADGVRLRQAPVLLKVFDSGDGKKIQLDLGPGAQSGEAADRGLLRALLLERALRGQKIAGERTVDPPQWMSAAFAASLGEEGAKDPSLYARLLQGGMPRLDKFLRQNGDSYRGRARSLYEAQSLALYDALAEMPDGRAKILQNLSLAEPSRDPVERFAQTWPELVQDPSRLARAWAVAVARLSAPAKMDFLSAGETSRRLGRLLEGLLPPGSPADPAEDLLALSREEQGRFRLAGAAVEMQRLGWKSHPLYAPIVEQYRELLENLSRKNRRAFVRRFRENEDLRSVLEERTAGITDYMNWFQANYEDPTDPPVIRHRETASSPVAARNDGISRFLDSVEKRGY